MSPITRLSLALLPIAFGSFLVLVANRLEHWAFPVVSDFTVTSVARADRGVILSGYMYKRRACQFVGVSVDAAGVEMGLKFLDDGPSHNATRPPGSQQWGPWQIYLPVAPPVKTLHVVAAHRCHPFWVTQTELITMPLPEMHK